MEIGSVFLILALFLLVGIFVGRPVFEKKASAQATSDQADHERSALLAERDRLITALKELEFDHEMGKIPAEDYPEQRARLMQRGAEVLRRLDTLEPPAQPQSIEERMEAAIAAHRPAPVLAAAQAGNSGNGGNGSSSRAASLPVAVPDDELEVLLSNRRRSRQDKAAGFCPKCGGPLQKSDRFCPKCGAKNL